MNATNRVVGRAALVVVGLLLLVLGAGAVLVSTLPTAAALWHGLARPGLDALGTGARRDAGVLAWTVVLGGAVVVGVLALVVLATIGGGRTGVVLEDGGDGDRGDGVGVDGAGVGGVVRIESAAVEHALSTAVGALPEVASLVVDVHRVRGLSAVRVLVRARRGASPRVITDRVEVIVADLDAVLGEELPVLLEVVRGGLGAGRESRVR